MSAGEGAEADCADRDPCEPFYIQMEISSHPSDFPVFAFAEDEVVMSGSPGWADGTCFEDVSGVRNARPGQLPDGFGGEFRGEADPVSLFHFIARVGEFRHEIAVVGKQDQTFAVLVEATGGDQPGMFRLGNEVDRFPGGMAVFEGADITARLVEHDIKFFSRGSDDSALIFHTVARHDPHGAAFGGYAVDGNHPGGDHSFGPATGTDAGCTQIFGQTDSFGIHGRIQLFRMLIFSSLFSDAFLSVFLSTERSGTWSGTRIRSLGWD